MTLSVSQMKWSQNSNRSKWIITETHIILTTLTTMDCPKTVKFFKNSARDIPYGGWDSQILQNLVFGVTWSYPGLASLNRMYCTVASSFTVNVRRRHSWTFQLAHTRHQRCGTWLLYLYSSTIQFFAICTCHLHLFLVILSLNWWQNKFNATNEKHKWITTVKSFPADVTLWQIQLCALTDFRCFCYWLRCANCVLLYWS